MPANTRTGLCPTRSASWPLNSRTVTLEIMLTRTMDPYEMVPRSTKLLKKMTRMNPERTPPNPEMSDASISSFASRSWCLKCPSESRMSAMTWLPANWSLITFVNGILCAWQRSHGDAVNKFSGITAHSKLDNLRAYWGTNGADPRGAD